MEYIRAEMNHTLTENGAVTYESTESDCLDLFSTIGALRHTDDAEIILRFMRAYTENPDIAMKLLFFARDIRRGLGERRVFRIIMKWLAIHEPETVKKNIEYVAEFGRFDDLLALFDTKCEPTMLEYIKKQLDTDRNAMKQKEEVSLLAKWLPSVNASNKETVCKAKRIAKALRMNDVTYRKMLTELRSYIGIIENNLRKKDYSFDYEKQPSKALFKYRKAFLRNDEEQYYEFISKVAVGEAKLHTEGVAPYEIVESVLDYQFIDNRISFMKDITKEEKMALNATWNALPDFGGHENTLVVVDTSGSMYERLKPCPASVALSLGLYFAERNEGIFKNHFIEFSEQPQLIEIKGETFVDKLRYVISFQKIANTNVEAVFDVILNAAVKAQIPQEQLPEKLIIVSDMEFDCCTEQADISNFQNAKAKFERFGYQLPNVIFWNVASRSCQQPVTRNEQGVALVSGVTPKIFSMIASGTLSPYTFMLEVLESERYAKIVA